MMKQPDGIDIIIPIYNAYGDLQKCIASILSCTDLAAHRLLLVNDASSDERILPYIKGLESKNILVIENEANLGFSGSINHGITASGDRDVILLNSDTIVTAGWVEKLIACAYSAAEIATVTPLSNNATLCSVPDFLKENTLPEGYTLEQYAKLIETVSLRLYPRIPVANGFCMYIKREVFGKIGLFDKETFERGYGEENDFCYRAEQIGYCHAMCDDTYIYHTGTTSFISEEKKKYIEAHEKILNERYPEQNHAVAVHCRDNPNEQIQENIKLWTGLLNGRGNILYLVQSDFREDAHDHLGGTQLHVKDMTETMRGTYNVFVAARNLDYLNLTAYTEKEEYTFKFYIRNAPQHTEFRNIRFAELYGNILDVFQIGLVHIHHTKGLTLELYYEAQKRNLPIITTLHDYYTICPSIKMMNCHGELCIGRPERQCCQECQLARDDVWKGTDYLSVWREEQRHVLEMSGVVITPSASSKSIVLSYYPELSPKISVIPHGMKSMNCTHHSETGQFHVAFVGGISKEKGSYTSYRLIKDGPSDIQWFLFGVWGYNELSMLDKKNYTKTGLYERDDLPQLIEKYAIDLICILPIWPETYCYTLSEAIMCGIPVIATDIGALGERMHELGCGWIVSVEHAYEETMDILRRIKEKGPEYQEKLAQVRALKVKTLEEMREEYLALYWSFLLAEPKSLLSDKETLPAERLFPRKSFGPAQDTHSRHLARPSLSHENLLRRFALDGFLLARGKKLCLEADGNAIQERLEQLDAQLTAVTTSFTYKCVRALGEIYIPGRKYIKKILYAAYRAAKRK